MLQFLFKDKNGLEVPFPSRNRITHGGTRRGQSSGQTASIITREAADDHSQETSHNLVNSSMDEKLSSNDSGSKRLSMLSWLWSSDISALSGGGSYKGINNSRKIDLNYNDEDLVAIQNSEQSIAEAAIQTRRSYGFRQEISRLRLVLLILLALILGVAVAFLIVGIHKSQQKSLSSSPPPTYVIYTPPKPKDELNLWCDLSLLLNYNTSSEDYRACYDSCVDGMCCFGDLFDTFPAMQENTGHHDCYSQVSKDVCQLYKSCENLIEARNQYVFNSNHSDLPLPPSNFSFICSLEFVSESLDDQLLCEELCSKAACCYPQHPSSCSSTEVIACNPYTICWNLDFVVASIDQADATQIQNPSNRDRNRTNV